MSDLSLPPLTLLPIDLDSDGVPVAEHGESFVWPAPPTGLYPAARPLKDNEACEIEGLNGRVMRVHLVGFDEAAGQVQVLTPGIRAPMPLRFAQFRRLVLPAPVKAASAIAASALLPYTLRAKAGQDRQGTTVGHVERGFGVFLFEPIDMHGAVRRVFIPNTAFDGMQVGDTLIGGTQAIARAAAESRHASAPAADGAASGALAAVGPPPLPTLEFEHSLPPAEPPVPTLPTSPAPATVGPAPATGAVAAPLLDLDFPGKSKAARVLAQGVSARPPATPAPVTLEPLQLTPAPAPAPKSKSASDFLLSKQVTTPEELLDAIERQAKMPVLRMGEALIALGHIDEARLQSALEEQRKDRSVPLGEILVRGGHIKRLDLQHALVRKMGYPVVDLAHFPPETDALSKVPYTVASRLQVLPLLLRPGRLFVAMEDPTRVKALDELEFASGCKVFPTLVNPGSLVAVLDTCYQKMGAEVFAAKMAQAEADGETIDANELLASLEMQGPDDAHADEDAGIEQSDNSLVRLINQMILEAQSQGVSDIHVESQPGREKVRIRFRRDGALKPYMELPHTYRSALLARIKIMCDLDISEKRKPQDGKIAFGKFHAGSKLELRVATIPTANGLEDAVLRLLASARPMPIDDIGLSPRNLGLLKNIVERPYGMFLCVGPTGSGKTTTLHSALGYINQPDRKIWTAEDPVEITQPGLRQVQVNPKIDWTFARALRAFLRADPDVIMVGEIRDNETATVAVESSLTGHLVLSTLHTNSAPETVTRLLDMGMDPFNFADALLGVLAQRLVRRICGNCKTSRDATDAEIAELTGDYLNAFGQAEYKPQVEDVLAGWRERFGKDGKIQHFHGAGCDKCGGTGLRGRAGVHELMGVSRDVRRLIQTGARVDELQKAAMAEGMQTLRQDGIEKVLLGVTTIAEVRATTN